MKKLAWEVTKYDIVIVLGQPFGVQTFHYEGGDARTNEVIFYNSEDMAVCFRQNEEVEVI